MVGYSTSEVYTSTGYDPYYINANYINPAGHAFNLVKLPGDSKFTLFDTVGGGFNTQPDIIKPNLKTEIDYPYHYCSAMKYKCNTCNPVSKRCMNDNYYGRCPSLSDIKGCS